MQRIYRTCMSLKDDYHGDDTLAMLAGGFITAVYGMLGLVLCSAAILTIPVWIVPYILWRAFKGGAA